MGGAFKWCFVRQVVGSQGFGSQEHLVPFVVLLWTAWVTLASHFILLCLISPSVILG